MSDEAVGIDDYGVVAHPLQRALAAFYGGSLNEPFSLDDGANSRMAIPTCITFFYAAVHLWPVYGGLYLWPISI